MTSYLYVNLYWLLVLNGVPPGSVLGAALKFHRVLQESTNSFTFDNSLAGIVSSLLAVVSFQTRWSSAMDRHSVSGKSKFRDRRPLVGKGGKRNRLPDTYVPMVLFTRPNQEIANQEQGFSLKQVRYFQLREYYISSCKVLESVAGGSYLSRSFLLPRPG